MMLIGGMIPSLTTISVFNMFNIPVLLPVIGVLPYITRKVNYEFTH